MAFAVQVPSLIRLSLPLIYWIYECVEIPSDEIKVGVKAQDSVIEFAGNAYDLGKYVMLRWIDKMWNW